MAQFFGLAAAGPRSADSHRLIMAAIEGLSWRDNAHVEVVWTMVREDSALAEPLRLHGRCTLFKKGDSRKLIKRNSSRNLDEDNRYESLVRPDMYMYWIVRHSLRFSRHPVAIQEAYQYVDSLLETGSFLDGIFPFDDQFPLIDLRVASQIGTVRGEVIQEDIDGSLCQVVTVEGDGWSLRAWIDPFRSNQVVQYSLDASADEESDRLKQHIVVKDVSLEQQSDGRWRVTGGACQLTFPKYPPDAREVRFIFSVQRTLIDPNPDFAKVRAFDDLGIPNGTPVALEVAEDNNEDEYIVSPIRHVWRDGKPVPDFDPEAVERIRRRVEEARGAREPEVEAD